MLQSGHRAIEITKNEFEQYVAIYHAHGRTLHQTRSFLLLPLIPPWNPQLRIWTGLVTLLDMFFTAIIFPFTLAWRDSDGVMLQFEMAVATIFVLDVLVNLHVPYLIRYKNDQMIVYRRKDILWLYVMQDVFFVDLISSVCYFIATVILLLPDGPYKQSTALTAISALRFLRFFKIFNITRTLVLGSWVYGYGGTLYNNGYVSLSTAYMFAICYCAVVIANGLSCIWWITGTTGSGSEPEDTWPYHAGALGEIANISQWRQYTSSIYYVVTTLSTTGYGDIIPCNTVEQIVAMGVMACGALFFAFVVGSVVNSMLQSSPDARRSALFKEKMEIVNSFLKVNCVSEPLHQEVFRYYADVWLRSQEEAAMWASINDLGPDIRAKIFADMLSPYVRVLEPFQALSESKLLLLAEFLEPVTLPPQMDVCVQGDEASCFWILHEGCVSQIKSGRRCGENVWAPGLLGTIALKKLGGVEEDWGMPGHGTTVEDGDRESGFRRERPEREFVIKQITGVPLLHPFTLRTQRTSTVFRLTISRLEAFLEGLNDVDMEDMRKKLLKAATQGSGIGQSSRTSVHH